VEYDEESPINKQPISPGVATAISALQLMDCTIDGRFSANLDINDCSSTDDDDDDDDFFC